MATFNYVEFTEKLTQALNQRAADMKFNVNQSTGSYHDRQDVCRLIDYTLDNTLHDIIVDVFLNSASKDVVNQNSATNEDVYTKEMIKSAFYDIDIKENCEVDHSSAEFSLSYNEVQLDEVDIDVDQDRIWKEFVSELENQKEKMQEYNQEQN